jgi:hypothetical protein
MKRKDVIRLRVRVILILIYALLTVCVGCGWSANWRWIDERNRDQTTTGGRKQQVQHDKVPPLHGDTR